jgi:hypothetical protein
MWLSAEPHTQPRAPTTDSVTVTVTVILSKITNRSLQDPIPSPLPKSSKDPGPFHRCVSPGLTAGSVCESPLALLFPTTCSVFTVSRLLIWCVPRPHSLQTTGSLYPQASQSPDYRFFVSPGLTVSSATPALGGSNIGGTGTIQPTPYQCTKPTSPLESGVDNTGSVLCQGCPGITVS